MRILRRVVLGGGLALLGLPVLAYDCSDYLRWNWRDRDKSVERRLGYYRFNPSYYTNVPSSSSGVKYYAEKMCLRDENKSKNLDDIYDEASIKEGMKKL